MRYRLRTLIHALLAAGVVTAAPVGIAVGIERHMRDQLLADIHA